MIVYNCDTQYSTTVLFPPILQTIITAQVMSTVVEGKITFQN